MDEIRPPKPLVRFDEFTQLDMRVARILECREHPHADKLLVLKIDLGTEQRQICAGLKGRYLPEELIGKLIVVVANMEPRSLRGEQSQGVLLTATFGLMKERLVLIAPTQDVPPGSTIA
jgi:tRNA-binding protein